MTKNEEVHVAKQEKVEAQIQVCQFAACGKVSSTKKYCKSTSQAELSICWGCKQYEKRHGVLIPPENRRRKKKKTVGKVKKKSSKVKKKKTVGKVRKKKKSTKVKKKSIAKPIMRNREAVVTETEKMKRIFDMDESESEDSSSADSESPLASMIESKTELKKPETPAQPSKIDNDSEPHYENNFCAMQARLKEAESKLLGMHKIEQENSKLRTDVKFLENLNREMQKEIQEAEEKLKIFRRFSNAAHMCDEISRLRAQIQRYRQNEKEMQQKEIAKKRQESLRFRRNDFF